MHEKSKAPINFDRQFRESEIMSSHVKIYEHCSKRADAGHAEVEEDMNLIGQHQLYDHFCAEVLCAHGSRGVGGWVSRLMIAQVIGT